MPKYNPNISFVGGRWTFAPTERIFTTDADGHVTETAADAPFETHYGNTEGQLREFAGRWMREHDDDSKPVPAEPEPMTLEQLTAEFKRLAPHVKALSVEELVKLTTEVDEDFGDAFIGIDYPDDPADVAGVHEVSAAGLEPGDKLPDGEAMGALPPAEAAQAEMSAPNTAATELPATTWNPPPPPMDASKN